MPYFRITNTLTGTHIPVPTLPPAPGHGPGNHNLLPGESAVLEISSTTAASLAKLLGSAHVINATSSESLTQHGIVQPQHFVTVNGNFVGPSGLDASKGSHSVTNAIARANAEARPSLIPATAPSAATTPKSMMLHHQEKPSDLDAVYDISGQGFSQSDLVPANPEYGKVYAHIPDEGMERAVLADCTDANHFGRILGVLDSITGKKASYQIAGSRHLAELAGHIFLGTQGNPVSVLPENAAFVQALGNAASQKWEIMIGGARRLTPKLPNSFTKSEPKIVEPQVTPKMQITPSAKLTPPPAIKIPDLPPPPPPLNAKPSLGKGINLAAPSRPNSAPKPKVRGVTSFANSPQENNLGKK